MKFPALAGEIERRLLINYRVDPAVVGAWLPAPFRPQIVRGRAVAGICLIRLGAMRPQGFPAWVGLRSENAAHRVAVEWDTPKGVRTGVYIPRRDSSSPINVAVGGRLYPGAHHRADFDVRETATDLHVSLTTRDSTTQVEVDVRIAPELTGSQLFATSADASAFFERGSVGFSATEDPQRFDGLQLATSAWRVDAGQVLNAHSSYFDDAHRFPPGTAELDCALVMRQIPVTWQPLPPLIATDPQARTATRA